MYQNIHVDRKTNTVHLWDDQKGYLKFPYKKYAYKKSPSGRSVTLDGTKVDKVTAWTDADIQKGHIYESDVNADTRTLVDMYHETDDLSIGHRELFFDIEVSGEGGYSTAENADNPLTSIAFYDKAGDRYVAILIDKKKKVKPVSEGNFILEVVQSEIELINLFLRYYLEIQPTILTGWNIEFFDIPYLYNRITKVCGQSYANVLSPINQVEYLKFRNRYKIMGVAILDYMALYKNFTYSEEPSYALDFICRKELGRGKIEYEGTLDRLYETDIDKFIKYNINDVELVVDLDNKLKFLDQARGICHKGHVPYEDIFFTTRYLDGACLTYMKRLGIVAPDRKRHNKEESEEESSNDFAGAFVKDPIPGLYHWIFDEDMASLYPSIIRSLNISPETKIGRFENWKDIQDIFLTGNGNGNAKFKYANSTKSEIVLVENLRNWLNEHNYSISAIGVVYDKTNQGLVPSILETWMSEREEYKALAKKHGKEGNIELARFFDARQLTMKIVNNSLYGALGAVGFRFHDLDNAESITLSGQSVIKHSMLKGNEWFTKQTGEDKEYVIYVDTDSNYFSAKPIIDMMEKRLGKELSKQEKTDLTFKTSQVVEKYINDSFDSYAAHVHNSNEHFFSIKQEYVSESGLWIAKKRYAQKIISEKGVSISQLTSGKKDWKLDVKGMDVVRSNFPKAFREFMSGILIDILNVEPRDVIDTKILNFREGMKIKPLLDIMFPTGVKEVSKFTISGTGNMFSERMKGTPIHVKSALNYNDLLVYYKIDSISPIGNGEKIKWTYLKNNPLGLDTLAVRGFEDPIEIIKFIEQYIDYERIFEASLENKLGDFYNALRWGVIPTNGVINDFFTF